MMLIGPANPDPGGQRGREAAAQCPQESRQACAVSDLARRQVRHQNAQGRHEEQRHADAHEQLHQSDVLEVDLIGELGTHEAAQADRQKRNAGEQTQVELVRVFADKRRQQHRQNPDRRHGKSSPSRGVAHLRLQPLRQDQVDAEEPGITQHQHQRADAEVAMGEQAQVDHRMAVGHFPDHEHRQRDHGNRRADNDEIRLEPVQVIALVEDHLQRANANDQGDQTDVIHWLATGHHRPFRQLRTHHHHRKDADRHVDEEDPRPAVTVGNPAAENGPGNRRDHRDHRQQCQGHPAFRRRIHRDQQRLRHRVQRPGDQALQHAKADQLGHRSGDTAEKRRQHKQHRRPQKQLHLAEAAAEPTGQRQRNRVAHGERSNNPGALLRTHPEVAGNRRQRHVGDGRVEHLHERRQRQADGAEQQAGRRERSVIAHCESYET